MRAESRWRLSPAIVLKIKPIFVWNHIDRLKLKNNFSFIDRVEHLRATDVEDDGNSECSNKKSLQTRNSPVIFFLLSFKRIIYFWVISRSCQWLRAQWQYISFIFVGVFVVAVVIVVVLCDCIFILFFFLIFYFHAYSIILIPIFRLPRIHFSFSLFCEQFLNIGALVLSLTSIQSIWFLVRFCLHSYFIWFALQPGQLHMNAV